MSSRIQINGITINVPDDVSVSFENGELYLDGFKTDTGGLKQTNHTPQINVQIISGSIKELKSDSSISCNNVVENVTAAGSVSCDDVGGNVKAGGSVSCDDIGGNVTAGGSISYGLL